MTRIIILSFEDVDVRAGVLELVEKYPDPYIVFPVTDDENFVESVWSVIKEKKLPFHAYFQTRNPLVDKVINGAKDFTTTANPVKEIIKQITSEDVFAIAWFDSIEDHTALHSVEDYGVDSWDISDGLAVLEILHKADEFIDSEEEVIDLIQDSVLSLIELMASLITRRVVKMLEADLPEYIFSDETPDDEDEE